MSGVGMGRVKGKRAFSSSADGILEATEGMLDEKVQATNSITCINNTDLVSNIMVGMDCPYLFAVRVLTVS